MIEGVLASGAVAPLALLVLVDVALLASTTQLRSRLPLSVPAQSEPLADAAGSGGRPRP